MTMLKKFWREEEGGESVEWPLVVALVAVGLVTAWAALQGAITTVLGKIVTELGNA